MLRKESHEVTAEYPKKLGCLKKFMRTLIALNVVGVAAADVVLAEFQGDVPAIKEQKESVVSVNESDPSISFDESFRKQILKMFKSAVTDRTNREEVPEGYFFADYDEVGGSTACIRSHEEE